LLAYENYEILSFGNGIHMCVGRQLAIKNTTNALQALLSEFGKWELVDQNIEWEESFLGRGLKKLRVGLYR